MRLMYFSLKLILVFITLIIESDNNISNNNNKSLSHNIFRIARVASVLLIMEWGKDTQQKSLDIFNLKTNFSTMVAIIKMLIKVKSLLLDLYAKTNLFFRVFSLNNIEISCLDVDGK